MINKDKLDVILSEYKKALNDKWWENEQFKWQAVKCFQENWDIEADDFKEMLDRSLSLTGELLTSANYFASRMIKKFAILDKEAVRNMFMELYDESLELNERVKNFKTQSKNLLSKTNSGSDFQAEYAITVYLWLKYPEKYYVYKYSEVKEVAATLDAGISFVKGHYEDNINNFMVLYDEINAHMREDEELVSLMDQKLAEIGCTDKEYRTFTFDVGFYISRVVNDVFGNSHYPGFFAQCDKVELIDLHDKYSKEDFLSEVYMDSFKYDKLVSVLRRKKNIVLQGAPGVGKTYCAKRLAYSMMGEKDENRIEFVQFHQNYCYEDFIMGYKPSGDGFELKHGIFYNFCKKAAGDSDNEYFFIIDEINRGNMSKIFGELLMLIEADYRGDSLKLAYEDIPFTVPKNLYIIGMMNTADRSLAMIDYALRRRFSFFDMEPGFETEGFKAYKAEVREAIGSDLFDTLISKVIDLNKEIEDDKSLGKGFCIGHSYFCNKYTKKCTTKWMQEIVEFDILPMLREYWFDDESNYKIWTDRLNSIFN